MTLAHVYPPLRLSFRTSRLAIMLMPSTLAIRVSLPLYLFGAAYLREGCGVLFPLGAATARLMTDDSPPHAHTVDCTIYPILSNILMTD